jgi:hypothetical protein
MGFSLTRVRTGVLAGLSIVAAVWILGPATVRAGGTVTIAQTDGHTDTYHDVVIKVIHDVLYITSADGRGTLIIHRAACAFQGQLLVCFPTSAVLVQSGETKPLDFRKGTLYVNGTGDPQPLALSTAKVPPHGILLSFSTDRGTYVSMSGRIDKVVK